MKGLLVSRKFWAAVLTVVVIVITSLVANQEGFELDTDTAAGMLVIAVSYILGVAVDPGPGGWRGVLQSRKFWAAVVGFTVMILDAFHLVLPFGLSSEILISFAITVGGYIAGVALELPKTSAA